RPPRPRAGRSPAGRGRRHRSARRPRGRAPGSPGGGSRRCAWRRFYHAPCRPAAARVPAAAGPDRGEPPRMATAANRWLPAAATALGAAWLARPRGGRFDGSTVLVTGGSRGLGLLLARRFARRGAHLALCARDVDELGRARRSIERDFGAQVLARRCDVTRRDEVEELVQAAFLRFGA